MKLAVVLRRVYRMPAPLLSGSHGFHSVKIFEDAAALKQMSQEYPEKRAEGLRKTAASNSLCRIQRWPRRLPSSQKRRDQSRQDDAVEGAGAADARHGRRDLHDRL